ncbi:MAG: MATE family efflux transporter [Oscillospiraceae bacterium]|nr:MATE family efflux transporter [Oscillospiraceae bacterium]
MKRNESVESFGQGSVSKVVLKNVLPAMAAQLMVLVYNLADTFFIAQTRNDYMVAAVSLATPVFLIFMSLGTLFGIGGTSVISRALGAGKKEYARKVSAFCMWGCVIVGGVLMILFWAFMEPLLKLLGASADTREYTREYLNIVISCGIFSMISNCYSNIIRAEGKAGIATTGTVVGNLLNMVLDPIMITTLGWNVAGAAIATVIGNAVAAIYYIIYFLRGKSSLSISVREASMKDGICSGVMAIGIPAALGTLLMSVSQVITNAQMAAYGDLSVAAYGVASKVVMIVAMVGLGVGMGVQPLLGFCHGAKDRERFNSILKFSCFLGLGICIFCGLLCFAFTEPIVKVFLTEAAALADGLTFTRIFISTAWLFGLYYVLLNALQAMGAATPSFVVSVCRQGIIYIPAVFVMDAVMGANGLVWAQPVADVLSLLLVTVLLGMQLKRHKS